MSQSRNSRRIRLLLVDDHEVVRVGLRTLFSHSQDIEVIGEAATADAAVSESARLKPDIVLMDVRLPDGSGVGACRDILANQAAPPRILFLTSFGDEDAMLSAVFAGAQGYLLKEIAGDSLVSAVRTVAAGHSILDAAVTRAMIEKMRKLAHSGLTSAGEPLSPQEQRVLALVAKGKTNKEIAVSLQLSSKTVKNYLSNIFQKLRVHRRSQAAVIYSQQSSR